VKASASTRDEFESALPQRYDWRMSKPDMFLAMILTNAKREEAKAVCFSVEGDRSRIDLLLLDGSSRKLAAPPPEIMIQIIERLEAGERQFESAIYSVVIERVSVRRGLEALFAEVEEWSIEHV